MKLKSPTPRIVLGSIALTAGLAAVTVAALFCRAACQSAVDTPTPALVLQSDEATTSRESRSGSASLTSMSSETGVERREAAVPPKHEDPLQVPSAEGPFTGISELKQDRTVEIVVAVHDIVGSPLEGATTVSTSHGILGCTDMNGISILTLPIEDGLTVEKAVIRVTAAGFADAKQTVVTRPAAPTEQPKRILLDITLEKGASIQLRLTDQENRPAAFAVVLLYLQETADYQELPAAGQSSDRIAMHRIISDAGGNAYCTGLSAGIWSVQCVEWRDCDDSDRQSVQLGLGAHEHVSIKVTRFARLEYCSGYFLDPRLSGDGGDTSDFYLRRVDAQSQTQSVYGDGFFALKASEDSQDAYGVWEIVHFPSGSVCGVTTALFAGQHDVVVESQCY